MRQFKFRAWEKGQMWYQVRCGGMFDGVPTAPTVWCGEFDGWMSLSGEPYTKIMQFTGIKDINGKEIYEGDIVQYGYIVTYIDGSDSSNLGMNVGFYTQRDNFESWGQMEVGEKYEVIGNIYENPDYISAACSIRTNTSEAGNNE